VEEAAAASQSLQQQAQELAQAVSVFRIDAAQVQEEAAPLVAKDTMAAPRSVGITAGRTASHTVPRTAREPRLSTPLPARQLAGGTDEWVTF